MDIIEKNMEALLKNNMILYGLWEKSMEEYEENKSIDEENSDPLKVNSSVARDGNIVLQIERDGKKVRLNSLYRPIQEAERWCAQYEFRNLGARIMMFGLGNGIFVEKILERIEEDAVVYVYEPSLEIFDYVMHHIDITSVLKHERVLLYVVGLNEDMFYYDLAALTHWSNLSSEQSCFHPGYMELFQKEAVKFSQRIMECSINEGVNKNTGVYFAKSFVENELRNLHFVLDGATATEFKECIDNDVPAIIVAAGPSLEKNIHLLNQIKGKAFIVATDTAVRFLLKEKAHFDCMVTIDPQKPSEYLLLPECRNVPLFCAPVSNAEILNYHTGKKIWFVDSGEFLSRFYKKEGKEFDIVSSGGNVASASWSLCKELGFKKIVLIGQDLAYGAEGTHVGGQVNGRTLDEGATAYVDGVYGEQVATRSDWLQCLIWYEREIDVHKKIIETIDATEGGALIRGAKVMTLQEVINQYCDRKIDFEKVFQDFQGSFKDNREKVKKDLLHIEKEIRNIEWKVESMMKIANEGLRYFENNPDAESANEFMQELSKGNKFIEKQTAYWLFEDYIEGKAVEVLSKLNVITGDKRQDQIGTMTVFYDYCRLLKEAIEELEPQFAESMKKIKKL